MFVHDVPGTEVLDIRTLDLDVHRSYILAVVLHIEPSYAWKC